MTKLELGQRISRRKSQEMILTFARFGNHSHQGKYNFSTDAAVKRFFEANGYEFQKLVEECRQYGKAVPFFENLIGSTFHVFSEGSGGFTASVRDSDGNAISEIKGEGELSLSTYQSLFEQANRQLFRAIESPFSAFGEFLSCCTSAISSVEAYLGHRVYIWNKSHPNQELIDDKDNKISFDQKITAWVPIMTGHSVNKSGHEWRGYIALRSVRDDVAVHPKTPAQGYSTADLVNLMNEFRNLAIFLMHLHILFNEDIPQKIIRAAYRPDIILVEG